MTQYPYSQYVQAAQAYGLQSASPEIASAYAVMWLRPGAPRSVVKAAYRALATQYHPDVGGDSLAMRRLNDAYTTLCSHLDA